MSNWKGISRERYLERGRAMKQTVLKTHYLFDMQRGEKWANSDSKIFRQLSGPKPEVMIKECMLLTVSCRVS